MITCFAFVNDLGLSTPRHARAISIALFLLFVPSSAAARVDPLRIITERAMRSEILIVLDTSGSMAWRSSPPQAVGSDCEGDRAGTVDLCGDGICTGAEGSALTPCPADCPTSDPQSSTPGPTPTCSASAAFPSRLSMVKRVLRNLLPRLSKSAAFGMVTFAQSGYFMYRKALSGGAVHSTSVYLSRAEMEQQGAWDKDAEAPRAAYARHGTGYTLLSGAGLTVTRDSLYARQDDPSIQTRIRWSIAGLTHFDGLHTWLYRGSYYVYGQRAADPAVTTTSPDYRGPQFTDAAGETWVHHRFGNSYTSQGISASSAGAVVVPLSPADSQPAQDTNLFGILSRMAPAQSGGLWAWGGTPTGPAIQTAEAHFFQRQAGSGMFAAAGADPAAACRPRFVLLLTDGQSNSGTSPVTAASSLYSNPAFGGNPIRTVVVGLPGLPSAAISELDQIADRGDDGQSNGSAHAHFANDEATLITVLEQAFLEILQGDYTTTPPGVTNSGMTGVSRDLALVSSTRYPGWKGHLRALDLTTEPPTERWEAGALLAARPWSSRDLFSGYPDSAGGEPVRLLAKDGSVNLDGGCSGCGTVGLRAVWQGTGATLPPDDEMRAVVRWMAGKDRPWKLGPIFRSTPASVGPPPRYEGVAGHEQFRKLHAARERLAYVTSNDGLLHAFRVRDGSEAFAYVPPNLWPKIHALWKRGGQPNDPAGFSWVLAASPRVEDIPPAAPPGQWSTQLLLTMGPGDSAFLALDITAPSGCKSVASCQLNTPPFRVVTHSRDLGMSSVMGETWSVPALFYHRPDPAQEDVEARVAAGSGYAPTSASDHYNFFGQPYQSPASALHSAAGAAVDHATLADTVAAVDPDHGRRVVATYQADLNGRVVRYHRGDSAQGEAVLLGGAQEPIYYSPAALTLGGEEVLLAAASGSTEEASPQPNAEATLYLSRDAGPSEPPPTPTMACKAGALCSGAAGCPITSGATCAGPSGKALPVAPPVLLRNEYPGGAPTDDAFYLLYEPPAAVCLTGSSWLVRVSDGGAGPQLVSATEYKGVRATGLSVANGRIDLAVARVGDAGEPATVFTVYKALQNGPLTGVKPYVESWKEIR